MSDMTLPQALNALRSGAKFWKAWAQVEEAAAVIESAAQNQGQQEARVRDLGNQIASLEGRLADAKEAVAAAEANAKLILSNAGSKAEAVLAKAHADGQAIKAGATRDAEVAKGDAAAALEALAEANAALASKKAEFEAAEAIIARAKAVQAALG